MKVYRSFEDFRPLQGAVVTQGTFDGVHVGHQKILSRLREMADSKGKETVLITFFPHPRMVLYPDDTSLKLLHTPEEKIEKMTESGIDHLLMVPFTREFSRLSSMQFIRDIIVNTIGAGTLVIGYDHRFGKNREGSLEDLREYAAMYGFEVEEIAARDVDEVHVSSTKIRDALTEGKVGLASRYLGYPYAVRGKVIRGHAVGRELGYPTANISVEEAYKLIPADGIYAVKVKSGEKKYGGMASIGFAPTFEGRKHAIEVNIFDFEEDIYGHTLSVEFIERIRAEEKFNSREALVEQLRQDKLSALKLLSESVF